MRCHRLRCGLLRRHDRGSATILVVAALTALLASAIGAMTLVGAVRASHQAHSAADLAALAGAMVLAQGESGPCACARAAVVAGQNRAGLVECHPSVDAVLEVVVTTPSGAPGLGPAVARSRAGPGT